MQDGLLISNLRQKHNITQIKMARLLKVSPSTYKLYEASIRPMSLETLNIISNYFKVSLDFLLKLTPENNYQIYNEEINYALLKLNLKLTRRKYKIRQIDLATEFKISLSALQDYENKSCRLNSSFLYSFAQKFNISVDYICGKTLSPKTLKKENKISIH